MKIKEIREVTITYCDYCGKEITHPYRSIEYKDGRKLDLCSNRYLKGEKSCFEKHNEEEVEKARYHSLNEIK